MEPVFGPGSDSGVSWEEKLAGLHSIAGVSTAITAFIGCSNEGPIAEAILVQSWVEYEAAFGGLVPGVYLGYAVNAFFSNGGNQAYIVRVAGPGGSMLAPGDGEFEAQLDGPAGYALLAGVRFFNLLCVPGETDATAVGKLQEFCAQHRAFLIVDSARAASLGAGPTGLIGTGPADGAGVSLAGPYASYSAFYFPWVVVPDPNSGDAPILLPPSGFVAGIYATTDGNRGVWKAPAGLGATLAGATGLQLNVTDEQNAQLGQWGVNCLRKLPEYGNVVWGARTIGGSDGETAEWKYVPIRRLALYIETSLYEGTKWVVFEPNDAPLWAQLRQSAGSFLLGLFNEGAFAGPTPNEAYFVKCDADNNPASSVALGVVNITVGFAPLYPAEFVIIQIEQMAGQS